MRPIPVDTPAFFNRGPSPLARLAFFGVLSLALLFADTRYRYLENVRQAVGIVLFPVQRALQMPGVAYNYVADYFGSKRELADENASLKQELVARAPASQGYARVQEENARLKALLDVRTQYATTATAVQVLYSSRDPFSQKLFVDKGSVAGVQAARASSTKTAWWGRSRASFPTWRK